MRIGNIATATTLPFALAALVSGCGTVARNREPFYPGLYPACRFDVDFISHHNERDMGDLWPFFILDFPISAGVDTMLLPWDVGHLGCDTTRSTNNLPE